MMFLFRAGDVIVGLSSSGKASYEKDYNSGMGSNGLTSARHDMLHKSYSTCYPESFDPGIPGNLVYAGNNKLTDSCEIPGIDIGKLILSPTRTYAPVVRKIFDQYRHSIHGMIHCSGGGQTKILNFTDDLHVIKNNMFAIPPLFRLIQTESGTSWQEMYRVFNMGHRLEFYIPESIAGQIVEIAASFNIDAQIIGHCEPSCEKKLTISTEFGEFAY